MISQVYAKAPKPRRIWPLAAGVAVASFALFGAAIPSTPHFADESAFLSQSFYIDLPRSDPGWLTYAAVDLPPLPKYLIGAALKMTGRASPPRAAARRWYDDDHHRADGAPTYLALPTPILRVARWPSTISGAAGVVALYLLGTTAAGDRRVGLLASLLLMLDPIYRLSASRAMADAPAEALILLTLAAGLWVLRESIGGCRPWLAATAGGALVGGLGGLAVLAKLNGGLGLMVVAAWSLAGMILGRGRATARLTAMLAVAGASAFGVFVVGNPLTTAPLPASTPRSVADALGTSPVSRSRAMIDHRRTLSTRAAVQFPHNATPTTAAKLGAVAAQGYGRFGPLGPPRHDSLVDYPRYAWSRDGGALLWIPWVLSGGLIAYRIGRQQRADGRLPTAWAAPIYAAVATITVAAFLPLAWDRYFLSIQPGSCLLAAFGAVGIWDAWRSRR